METYSPAQEYLPILGKVMEKMSKTDCHEKKSPCLATPPHTPSLPSAMQTIAVPGIPESLLDFEPLHRVHSLDGTFTPPSASEQFLQCLTLSRAPPTLTHHFK